MELFFSPIFLNFLFGVVFFLFTVIFLMRRFGKIKTLFLFFCWVSVAIGEHFLLRSDFVFVLVLCFIICFAVLMIIKKIINKIGLIKFFLNLVLTIISLDISYLLTEESSCGFEGCMFTGGFPISYLHPDGIGGSSISYSGLLLGVIFYFSIFTFVGKVFSLLRQFYKKDRL